MIEPYCDLFAGLMLVGGEDINPELYGEAIDSRCKPLMPRRDWFESKLLLECHRRRIPILGICRGLQIMNVAFGGTLHQDLSDRNGAGAHGQIGQFDFSTRHSVKIVEGTRLHEIIGATLIETNTGHHQGINKLGDHLKISALAEDGVIEAVEGEGFTIGVQWHPEAWQRDDISRKLFSSFSEAATEFLKSSDQDRRRD